MNIKITALLILLFFFVSCGKQEIQQKKESVIPVKTASVKKAVLARPIRTSGILSTESETKLSFKIGGIIDRIFTDDGQDVKKDDLLASLKLNEINAQVQQAKSGVEKAQRDFNRVRSLYSDSVVTLQQFQDAKTGLDVAKSNSDIAEFNLQYAEIKAPCNGTILKKLAEENELIGAGHPVYIFGTTGRQWRVKTGVIDKNIVEINIGDSAEVEFDAIPAEIYPGIISGIAAAPDPGSGLFEVEITLPSDNEKLKNGFICRTTIYPSDKKQYFMVPFACLVNSDGKNGYIFTIDQNDRARKIPVTIDFIMDESAALSRGVETIESVITDGADYLKDGMKVRICDL